MILYQADLPDSSELRGRGSVYYAYDHLIRFILGHAGVSDVQPKYYLQVGQGKAHTSPGADSIGFNLYYLESQLPKLAEIIDAKLPATDAKVQNFLEEAIFVSTHEIQHHLEGSGETQWTHNDVFFEGQRQVVAKFLTDQSVNFQKILDEIYKKCTSSFVPAKQFVEQMRLRTVLM